MTMDAALKESSGILKITALGKARVTTLGIFTEGWVHMNQGGVEDGGGMAREHGPDTSDNTIPYYPRLVNIILYAIILVSFICVLLRHFYLRCTDLQHDVRTSDHQTPPEPPSIAPLESIWVTSLDPPPPYSQVGLSVPIPNVFHNMLK